MIRIPLDKIDRNVDQPRKDFDESHIKGLAASIKRRGLLQPITVRPHGYNGGYEIVAGECRWRAHKLLVSQGYKQFREIGCNVVAMSKRERDIAAIIENVQRADMNPIDEANGYQALIESGMTLEEVATELGKGTESIKNRLKLLKLPSTVQTMVRKGQLTPAMGSAISWAPENAQTKLVREISVGKLKTVEQVRHAAIALRDAEAQVDAFAALAKPSKQDIAAITALENKIEAIGKMVQSGFKDGECVAAKRIAPGRLETAANKLSIIRKHVLDMEHALRCAAAQGEMLKQEAA